RQLSQHLDSLRAGGVEFAPAAPPPASVPLPTVQTSLFAQAAAPATGDAEQRKQALADLTKQVAACTRCKQLASTRTQTVFGVGRLSSAAGRSPRTSAAGAGRRARRRPASGSRSSAPPGSS